MIMRKGKKITLLICIATVLSISVMIAPSISPSTQGELVAYRGGGQIVKKEKKQANVCNSSTILRTNNQVIENTILGVDKAVRLGFQAIHLNVQRTADDRFVVFHDRRVNCATEGEGQVSNLEADFIRSLDAGYDYTFDSGTSFPWRGKGISIPLLAEIIKKYPSKSYWLNLKSGDPKSVELLLEFLENLNIDIENQIVFISNTRTQLHFQKLRPKAKAVSVASTRRCIKQYIIYGWSRIFPEACKNTILLVPPKYAKLIWGWPSKFAGLAQSNGSEVYLWTTNQQFHTEYDLRVEGVGTVTGDLSFFVENSEEK